jgi:hypothetical protein
MKRKYTPGPWLVVPNDSILGGGIVIQKTPRRNGGLKISYGEGLQSYGRHYANAHLIGASPDMLAVLEMIVQEFNNHESYTDGWVSSELSNRTIKALKKAIKKARGE